MDQYNWPLGNGKTIPFQICDPNAGWKSIAGLYIFSHKTSDGSWQAVYIGQTDDFSSRLPSHERWDEAHRNGATHIHAVSIPHQSQRDSLEDQLVRYLQPPLNTHFR
ncbi:GIY-YIG nuclease family protein [Microbulbifer sp. 2201CG32-9]|uniref:hypothetical protein n=1 Tax=Microbulbifer sp. 2201CG32-9 TaxID=3232309 RepID=UPI00345C213B